MPTICNFFGIKVFINWKDHQPPHFHAEHAGKTVVVSIQELEVMRGDIPGKQLKMLLGWAALHQEELLENWDRASKHQTLFPIDPLR